MHGLIIELLQNLLQQIEGTSSARDFCRSTCVTQTLPACTSWILISSVQQAVDDIMEGAMKII